MGMHQSSNPTVSLPAGKRSYPMAAPLSVLQKPFFLPVDQFSSGSSMMNFVGPSIYTGHPPETTYALGTVQKGLIVGSF